MNGQTNIEEQRTLTDFKSELKTEEEKRAIKDAELKGTLILFDLSASTELKQKRGFPGWFSDLKKFHKTIFESFESEIKWHKFLGDGYMFFFPDEEFVNLPIFNMWPILQPSRVIDLCEKVMNEYWDFYKVYSRTEKGAKKNIEFRQMTCVIDYGNEIINWYQVTSDNEVKMFDPIGTPVDRCFRISNIAGPGQLLISNSFYKHKLRPDTDFSDSRKERLEKISLVKNSLKGFPDETEVWYLKPSEEQVNYILSEENAELVENARSMSTKVKIRLLRKKLK